jgi:hypothetical protein
MNDISNQTLAVHSIWRDGGTLTRRDACHLLGEQAHGLNSPQSAKAWKALSEILMDELAVEDVPKFKGLLAAIQRAMAISLAEPMPFTDEDFSDD